MSHCQFVTDKQVVRLPHDTAASAQQVHSVEANNGIDNMSHEESRDDVQQHYSA
jgi:hypothetical protein